LFTGYEAGTVIPIFLYYSNYMGMGTRRKSSRPRRNRDVGLTSRDES